MRSLLIPATLILLLFLAATAISAPSQFLLRADFTSDTTGYNFGWIDGNSPWQVWGNCLGTKFPEVQVGKVWYNKYAGLGIFGDIWPQTELQDEELFVVPDLELFGTVCNADAYFIGQWYVPLYANGPDAVFTDLTMKWPVGDLKAGFDARRFYCGGGAWRFGPVASYKIEFAEFTLAYLNRPDEIRLGLTLQ
jgi:hypothetical protein